MRVYLLPSSIFLLCLLLASLFSTSLHLSFIKFLNTFVWFLFFFLIIFYTKKKEDVRFFVLLILEIGLITFILGYLPYFSAVPQTNERLTSIFAQSDVYGGFLLLIFPIAFSFYLFSSNFWNKFVFGATTIFLCGAIFLTFSRGTWLVALFLVAASFIFLVIKKNQKISSKFIFLFLFVIMFLGFFEIFNGPNVSFFRELKARMFSIKNYFKDSSVAARLSFWNAAMKIAVSNPFIGVGQGNFGKFFPRHQDVYYYYSRFPHNWYLQIASETGFISLFALLWLFALVLKKNLLILIKEEFSGQDQSLFQYRFALLLSLTGGLLHLMMDVESNFSTYSILFFGEMGLLAALSITGSIDVPLQTVVNVARPAISSSFFTKIMRLGVLLILLMLLVLFSVYQTFNYWGERFHEKAKMAENEGKIVLAQSYALTAGKLLPYYSPILETQGRLKARQFQITRNYSDLVSAIKLQETAIKLDSSQASYYVSLSHLYSLLSNKKEATNKSSGALKKGLALDPVNYPYFYLKLGNNALVEKNMSEASSYFKELILRYPKDTLQLLTGFRRHDFIPFVAAAYLGLGQVSADTREYSKASSYFQKALQFEKEPEAFNEVNAAHFYLGQLELKDKKYRRAISHFEKAKMNSFLEFASLQYLAFSLWKSGDFLKAKEELSKIIAKRPQDVDSLYLLGSIAKDEGKLDNAKKYWTKALIYAPGDKVLLKGLRSLPTR